MNLANINNQPLNQFARQHIVKQQKKQEYQVFKQNKKAEQALNPSHLKNLNYYCQKIIASYLPYLDQVSLVSTCEELRGKHPFVNPFFSIDTIKRDEVNQFINLFRDNNGEFKSINTLINEINNRTIILHQNPFVLKEGVKTVFSNMDDAEIKDLLVGIKYNISQNKLDELASMAINKMSDDHAIRYLLVGIKDNISQNKLEELASIAIEKMSDDIEIYVLLVGIKDNISMRKKFIINKFFDIIFAW